MDDQQVVRHVLDHKLRFGLGHMGEHKPPSDLHADDKKRYGGIGKVASHSRRLGKVVGETQAAKPEHSLEQVSHPACRPRVVHVRRGFTDHSTASGFRRTAG
jgi:hypothetical protein